jgi:CheY-like chemotaxis protein
MHMPEMDGVTLARAIRTDARLAGTKLVILTSMCQRVDPKELQEAGIQAWLTKPVKEQVLHQALANVMGQPQGPVRPSLSPTPLESAPQKRVKILLAEDSPVNQKVALSQLRRLGCEVELANNGLEAVQAITRDTYDLVFMDCQMPDMDGYQATREIRLLPGARARTPIIAMTANAMQGDEQKCLDAGMDAYISKPVKLEVLRGMIQEYAADPESDFPLAKAAERLAETVT